MSEESQFPAWLGAACNGCGKCCTNEYFMGTLTASSEDINRWTREGRDDILRFVKSGDLWIDDNGREYFRCPFVRKNRGKSTYRCTIYETRPEVCRNYPSSYSHMISIGCEIIDVVQMEGKNIEEIMSANNGEKK